LNADEIMHIDVEMMRGNHWKKDMITTDTVLDIKKGVHKDEHVDLYQLVLYLNGKMLADHETLETVKTQAGSNSVTLKASERINLNV